MYDPRTFRVEQDRDGFYVADDENEDVIPTQRFTSYKNAKLTIDQLVSDHLDALKEEVGS
jgi:hypothetical protein